MNDVIEKLLKAKEEKGLTFEEIAKELGRNPVWVAALLYRQATASPEEAEKLKNLLGLDDELAKELTKPPYRGNLIEDIPRDPVIYRFYEILQVYGLPLKAVIHEMFGDGIMSAIDFTIDVKKQEDPKGDRVVIVFNGKFLPYKRW
jgi:cyanate lyase